MWKSVGPLRSAAAAATPPLAGRRPNGRVRARAGTQPPPRPPACSWKGLSTSCAATPPAAGSEAAPADTRSTARPSYATRRAAESKTPPFAVAPMVAVTDVHFRYLCRLLSPNSTLYTEMVHAGAWRRRPPEYMASKFAAADGSVLQLAGHQADWLRTAAEMARGLGWKEINLNVGCPSDKVQKCKFGVVLMKEPHLVAELCRNIAEGLGSEGTVTVKCRVGVDDLDSYEFVHEFVHIVSSEAPVTHFIVHARKAYLNGISPEQNRKVPPLDHPRVYQLKKDFPHLCFTTNGGITSMDAVHEHLDAGMDGVMVGRKVQDDPYFLVEGVERGIYDTDPAILLTKEDALNMYIEYARKAQSEGERTAPLIRAASCLSPSGVTKKRWRRLLAEARTRASRDGTELCAQKMLIEVLEEAQKPPLYSIGQRAVNHAEEREEERDEEIDEEMEASEVMQGEA